MGFNRRRFLAGAAVLAAAPSTPLLAQTRQPTPVVATFSILGDMVARIGGDRVALTTLVGRNGDPHVYQPKPDDARAVSSASLLVANGLAFEGWLDRLVDASDFKGVKIVATDGVDLISFDDEDHEEGDHHGHKEGGEKDHDHDDHAEHDDHAQHADHDDHDEDEHAGDHHGHDHGEFDPHAWQDLSGGGVVYARNIEKALIEVDPDGAQAYSAAADAYVAEMKALDGEIREMIGALPADRRTIVTSHDAFGYFGRAYGVEFFAPQGLSTEVEASAADVARLITQIKEQGVDAVFVDNISDRRLIEQIARETGSHVGGTLYAGALSDPDGPAATYLDMMRHNARTIAGALSA